MGLKQREIFLEKKGREEKTKGKKSSRFIALKESRLQAFKTMEIKILRSFPFFPPLFSLSLTLP